MKSNSSSSNLEISSLLALCAKLNAALEGAGAAQYGVPVTLTLPLSAFSTVLQAAVDSTEAKRIAYLTEKQTRDTFRANCARAAAAVSQAIYASPSVSPAMIVAAGLTPRSTSRTKVVPVTPAWVRAIPKVNGDVQVEWDRTGNAPGVGFVLETKTPGGEWRYAGTTTATRLVVKDCTPGVLAMFRVIASKNAVAATPSADVAVFPTKSSAPALKEAA